MRFKRLADQKYIARIVLGEENIHGIVHDPRFARDGERESIELARLVAQLVSKSFREDILMLQAHDISPSPAHAPFLRDECGPSYHP
jgi:hypothetical protein